MKKIIPSLAELIALLPLIGFSIAHSQDAVIRINEFMALNSTTLKDSDGVYSDWLEIYNPTSAAVNLLNWSLSDDSTDIAKWKFPNISLLAMTAW